MELLENNILFIGLEHKDIAEILDFAGKTEKEFNAGETIVHQGDVLTNIGIVLSGRAVGKKYTPDGEEIIVSRLKENSIFGDVLSGANGFASPVTVAAVTKCRVLFIDYNGLLFSNHRLAGRVLQNMIANISHKYFSQNRRMDILMLKSVRSKIVAYLEWQIERYGANSFSIDLDRRLMADFLGVERSALSRELSRMKEEGLIDYHKNTFKVLW